MTTIPLYIILFLYLFFIAMFAAFIFVNVFHLSISASLTVVSFGITLLIFILGSLTLYTTWSLVSEVDWRAPIVTINTSSFAPNRYFGAQ